MKTLIWGVVIACTIGALLFGISRYLTEDVTVTNETPDKVAPVPDSTPQDKTSITPPAPTPSETASPAAEALKEQTTTIGTSVEQRPIVAHHFGTGDREVVFVGGIHGGYEWNTSLVAYELIAYLEKNLDVIPENVRVTVIPALNPDGLVKIIGTAEPFTKEDAPKPAVDTTPGRFNANMVDLNRNFDCDWKSEGIWQNRTVSGGSKPFSEPESRAFRAYIDDTSVSAVVVWYSAAGGVFASNCHNGVLPETQKLTDLYARASGYPAYQSFDYYAITGDMVNWLAAEQIPAISVLLTNHTDTEWNKNKAGVEAILTYIGEQ